ncbi:hypothetical protein GTW20_21355 [Nocardiopsis alba]|uniref:Uncharacterized protein n=1 Tax=Nocardiopsis alba TaxID=53437 RepID=A0A7K2IXL6_9ACTN|nr:hypothetical protein [Nocardiopsis alba]
MRHSGVVGPAGVAVGAGRRSEHVTVETPPAGSPSLARYEGLAALALRGMATELRSRGIEAREDGARGIVHTGPAARPQGAALRPHRGDLWWWMRWPSRDGTPDSSTGVPLTPVERTSDAVRRIVGVMAAVEDG